MVSTMPARLFQLLSLLQSRSEWSGTELAERLSVTSRTVRRDIERLRELGYPVAGTAGAAGGYRMVYGKNLPPLMLDDAEAVAVAIGLRTTAKSVAGMQEGAVRALVKLDPVLPNRLRREINAVSDQLTAVPAEPVATVDPTVLIALAMASREQDTVAFGYQRGDGSTADRRVEPYQLVATHGLWYLVGYDLDRADWRVFRVDRISSPRQRYHRFEPRELPAAGPAEFVAGRVAEAPRRFTARAEVAAPADTVRAIMPRMVRYRVEPVDATSCVVRLGQDTMVRICRDILGLLELDVDVRIDCSPRIAERISVMAERLRAAIS